MIHVRHGSRRLYIRFFESIMGAGVDLGSMQMRHVHQANRQSPAWIVLDSTTLTKR